MPPRSSAALLPLIVALVAACKTRPTPDSGAPPGTVTVAALGDVANCNYRHGDDARATAELLRARPGVTVLVAGDIAYGNGKTDEFSGCFDPLWGFLKDRIRPAPGNHEYGLYLKPVARDDAAPYFAYFGASAGPPGKGFYSFDVGASEILTPGRSRRRILGDFGWAPQMRLSRKL